MDRRSLPTPAGVIKTAVKTGKKYHNTGLNPRPSLPHAQLGEINLTCAKDKTYICHRAPGESKWKHVLCVRGTSHASICQKIFHTMSEDNMSKEEAMKLRLKLQTKAN